MQLRGLCLVVLVAAACGDDKNDSATDTSTGGETSGATQGMSSTPTEASAGTTADSGTTTSPDGTSGEATSMGATSVDPSGGDELCAQLCAKASECMVDLGPGCAAICEGGPDEPACAAATDALYSCLIGLDCAAFEAAVEDEDFGACTDEAVMQEGACAGQVCESSIGTNEDGTECSYRQECPEGLFEMDCDAVTCTCATDSMPSGECAADGVCMAIEEIAAKAQTCCGFE